LTINIATGFSAISHQEKVVHRLVGFLRSGSIPHALLFTGIDGIGKKKTALAFAMALNCRTAAGRRSVQGESVEPCGACRPCKKIAAGHHPDVITVEPERFRIRISAIRDLGNTLAVKPYEALQRVVIIDQAQAMNPQAGNALLKLLEEPPAKTLLILIAVNTYSLLPTIVSRCQQVGFKPIPDQVLAAYLEKKGMPPEKAAILGKLANGSYAKADGLAGTDWLRRREWVTRVFEHLGAINESGRRAALSMALSEMLAKDKDSIDDILEFLKSWFRDMAVVKSGSENVINQDLLPRVRHAARRVSTLSVLSSIDRLESARKKIAANANVRLTLDVTLMNLFPGVKGK
jgi:DNA polymerase-3 subunit delta'